MSKTLVRRRNAAAAKWASAVLSRKVSAVKLAKLHQKLVAADAALLRSGLSNRKEN